MRGGGSRGCLVPRDPGANSGTGKAGCGAFSEAIARGIPGLQLHRRFLTMVMQIRGPVSHPGRFCVILDHFWSSIRVAFAKCSDLDGIVFYHSQFCAGRTLYMLNNSWNTSKMCLKCMRIMRFGCKSAGKILYKVYKNLSNPSTWRISTRCERLHCWFCEIRDSLNLYRKIFRIF